MVDFQFRSVKTFEFYYVLSTGHFVPGPAAGAWIIIKGQL
jgi:hypothetical protein